MTPVEPTKEHRALVWNQENDDKAGKEAARSGSIVHHWHSKPTLGLPDDVPVMDWLLVLLWGRVLNASPFDDFL